MTSKLRFFQIAFSPTVSINALKVSLVVGSILVLINYGIVLMNFEFTFETGLKALLNYLVPYCVSTYSAVKAIQNEAIN